MHEKCPSAALRALLEREVFTPMERDTGAVPTHEIDELLLLSSWFRRFPEELGRTRAIDLAPLAESAAGAA